MSYDNVGLSTPRGSGTSGYVQRSLAHMKPRDRGAPYPPPRDLDSFRHRQRQPDKAILEHDRKREVEVKVFELRDRLEDEGVDEDEIDKQCDALRQELLDKMNRPPPNNNNNNYNRNNNNRRGPPPPPGPSSSSRNLKMHQVHELADAKIKQDARFRNALKISKDYQEGGHWKRQEERLRKAQDREAAGDGPSTASATVGPDVNAAGRRGSAEMYLDNNNDDRRGGRGGGREEYSRSRSRSRSRSLSRTPSRSPSRSRSPPPRSGGGGGGGADRQRRYSSDRSGSEEGQTRGGGGGGRYDDDDDQDDRRRSRSPDQRGPRR